MDAFSVHFVASVCSTIALCHYTISITDLFFNWLSVLVLYYYFPFFSSLLSSSLFCFISLLCCTKCAVSIRLRALTIRFHKCFCLFHSFFSFIADSGSFHYISGRQNCNHEQLPRHIQPFIHPYIFIVILFSFNGQMKENKYWKSFLNQRTNHFFRLHQQSQHNSYTARIYYINIRWMRWECFERKKKEMFQSKSVQNTIQAISWYLFFHFITSELYSKLISDLLFSSLYLNEFRSVSTRALRHFDILIGLGVIRLLDAIPSS